MGGDKRFIQKLDSLFTMYLPDEFFAETEDVTREGILGNYVHGNEVSQHIPYLYAWTSEPWKTQYWVREIMNKMYQNNIDGLCGNDDCGQMSAWYIFTAMGFYPVAPGTDQYVIGAPYLPYMKVNLGDGKSLTIRADKVSDKNRYVQSVTLNGEPIKTAYLTHNQIMGGGRTELRDGSQTEQKADLHARTAALLADTGRINDPIRSDSRIRSTFPNRCLPVPEKSHGQIPVPEREDCL